MHRRLSCMNFYCIALRACFLSPFAFQEEWDRVLVLSFVWCVLLVSSCHEVMRRGWARREYFLDGWTGSRELGTSFGMVGLVIG